MTKRTNNDAAEFFENLFRLGELFGTSLNSYLNEDYDEVESPKPETTEESEDDCTEMCSGKCVDEETTAGPSGPAEEYDEYKLIISDYSVKTYEDALKVMTPKLNQMTFSMRIFAFGQAIIEFRFSGISYKFIWDRGLDKFIGLEDNAVITKEVYWDEVSNQVKELKPEEPEVEETPTEEVPGTECRYKGESFYPYGEKCKDCPHKDECFTTEDQVEEDHESCAATYTEDGDAIVEEEIPSLTDYVGKKSEENKKPNGTLTGASLYKKLNDNFKTTEKQVIEYLLNGVTRILSEDAYDIDNSDPSDTQIHRIKFNFNLIKKYIPAYKENIEEHIHMQNLADEIKNRFEFKEVFVDADNNIYCELV